jgi:hypothetical protein
MKGRAVFVIFASCFVARTYAATSYLSQVHYQNNDCSDVTYVAGDLIDACTPGYNSDSAFSGHYSQYYNVTMETDAILVTYRTWTNSLECSGNPSTSVTYAVDPSCAANPFYEIVASGTPWKTFGTGCVYSTFTNATCAEFPVAFTWIPLFDGCGMEGCIQQSEGEYLEEFVYTVPKHKGNDAIIAGVICGVFGFCCIFAYCCFSSHRSAPSTKNLKPHETNSKTKQPLLVEEESYVVTITKVKTQRRL